MRSLFLFVVTLSLSLVASSSFSTSVLQMNLAELTEQSEKIFRGTLIDVKSSKVEIGGGELSTLIYTFRVSDVFKGEVETQKGVRLASFEMLGTMDKHSSGKRAFVGMPVLLMGESYLLMVAKPGDTGLTAPMGLGQGAFRIYKKSSEEVAVNEFSNLNLQAPNNSQRAITGADHAADKKSTGPIPYQELAAQINSLVNQ